ncbi:hypothetical protein M011DRAFT_405154 [Sporormia fimetaria CBS 119925]|uniref:Sm domain-containing protein n=1 Tax=Sporormia fimetaria CBS 119925 TaxID=1340428 RepID=A0A6A6VA08_9PLEO|nr:hypothetical protein M011DRAFT_405154 [Sporormia fimetaria CBS 119925]
MATALDNTSSQVSVENAEATSYLEDLIGSELRIHTSDNRVFGGVLKCTDKDRNVILGVTYEYREPSAEAIRKAVEESGNPTAPVNWISRFVGLVVVPGEHIRKIELQEKYYGSGYA